MAGPERLATTRTIGKPDAVLARTVRSGYNRGLLMQLAYSYELRLGCARVNHNSLSFKYTEVHTDLQLAAPGLLYNGVLPNFWYQISSRLGYAKLC